MGRRQADQRAQQIHPLLQPIDGVRRAPLTDVTDRRADHKGVKTSRRLKCLAASAERKHHEGQHQACAHQRAAPEGGFSAAGETIPLLLWLAAAGGDHSAVVLIKNARQGLKQRETDHHV
jgi:hypothetical protein